MARALRVHGVRPKPARREPATLAAWLVLLNKAINRARALEDRRLAGLEACLQDQRRIPTVLKKMGIICDADITREFG